MGLILASNSPRRKKLLQKAGYDFIVIPSNVNEENITAKGDEITTLLARAKAQDVYQRHGGLVLGADTLVFLGDMILGKPHDKAHAIEILSSLSGNTHKVVTGVALAGEFGIDVGHCVSYVSFEKVSLERIEQYVDTCKPYDKAGAYGLQELSGWWKTEYSGEYDNILGLPIKLVNQMIQRRRNYLG